MHNVAWKSLRTGENGYFSPGALEGAVNPVVKRQGNTFVVKPKNEVDFGIVPELNLEETTRVRSIFFAFVREEYVTTKFELRVLLSELGLYPSSEEIAFVLNSFENKMSFTNVCHYLRFYKKKFQVSARQRNAEHSETTAGDEGEDTLRAFVSLGGNEDGTGCVSLDVLRQVCHNFDLTIDIDAMLSDIVDIENQTTLSYAEFCSMWRSKLQRGGYSTTSSMASHLELFGSVLAFGTDNSTVMCANPAKSESSATAGIAARSCFPGLEENTVESYKFPQSSECVDALSPAQQREDENALFGLEKEHMRQLKCFLCTDTTLDLCSSAQVSLGRRRVNGSQSGLPALPGRASLFDPDGKRADAAVREDGGRAAGGTRKSGNWACSMAATGGAIGGYRAPSPLILSLRNSNAYKRRLRAFAQKVNAMNNNKKGCTRKRDHSVALDDDAGRN